jgi:hypothetical protein
MTLDELIDSHRNLINELNRGKRKEWRDAIQEARDQAHATALDERYVLIESLKKMTLEEVVALLGYCEWK